TIGLLLYSWFVVGLGFLIFVGISVLYKICYTLDMAAQAVVINKLRAYLHFRKRCSRNNKILRMTTRAVLPVRLKYGFFGYLGKEFVGEYFHLLAIRTFDAVILFNYEQA